MKNRILRLFLAVALTLITTASAFATGLPAGKRVVVDQLGRKVLIPQKVERVVCLMHHALDITLELQAGDRLVGIMKNWEGLLFPGIADIYPPIRKLPQVGTLTEVNMEELLKTNPDLVIVTHYFPQDTLKKIEAAGIPVVAVSLYQAGVEEASKLNPKLKNPDRAYTIGMRIGVGLLGEIYGREREAKRLNEFVAEKRAIIGDKLSAIPENQKITCYMANPDLYTYGSGKYVGVIMDRAGGINVAREISGFKAVNMEQILEWDPQVIFVQDRYAQKVVPEITEGAAWAPIRAVKEHRVYVTPEYVKPWGHPCPESMALGELWMAKKLYPEHFKDVDIDKTVQEFYKTFYGIPYQGKH
ncbi:ABC transporter substrate-binding protein [Cloacibacillus porcorum]|uniref:ABC transporter substrate-binding protein n=1 Tax=Cloacibacillus porcorum TaxID=1197717 RepID=UPI00258D1898|nr:ABC transporter substrate-binding protein [Cloacibacillus porcorum]